jgi:hypothetical protein
LDDFGTGYSGLKTLYYLDPQYIKIDRFFITDILKDKKKKLFISNIINIAHQSGIKVLAEGVETLDELNVCRDIGCDLAQGYYIQKPVKSIGSLQFEYPHVKQQIVVRKDNTMVCGLNLNLNYIFSSTSIYSKIFDKYIMLIAIDLNGYISHVSSAFCIASGFTKDELINSNNHILKYDFFSKKILKR